jgi:formylglycine-generating enzyme required for sulfatase activity
VSAAALTLAALAAGAQDDSDKLYKTFVDELIAVTPGEGKFPKSYTMGSSFDGAPAAEKPARKVEFAKSFRMAKYEVPQNLYEAVMGANPSRWKGPRNSAEMMNFDDAWEFCKRLTKTLREKKLIKENEVVRLPSEAEWEYCCRAGTDTRWSFGDDEKMLTDYCWYNGNAAGNDPPVGAKKANAWGFHDMHGYCWEFCRDVWAEDYTDAPADGSARIAGDPKVRVARGGAWTSKAPQTRSAIRARVTTVHTGADVGFRCVVATE